MNGGGMGVREYLMNIMRQHCHGLYLCELPTGNGKTFESAQAMKAYADTITDNTKIIYLTTLTKNFPEKELKAAYGNDEAYNRNVLRIRSNFDEVVSKILNIEIPEEMKTDSFLQLYKDVHLYVEANDVKLNDKEYIKELEGRINKDEVKLRHDLRSRLKTDFSTRKQRKNSIKNNQKYKWIGELYPAVFTEDYKILLMSVSKFMTRNSILIDASYEFLKSDLIENAIIIIDEFDATKDTIQKAIIEKSLAMKEDYVQLFRQIMRTLNPNDFSSDMRKAMNQIKNAESRAIFNSLIADAKRIAEDYHIRLSMKTNENIDLQQTFLFHDGSFHTVLKKGTQYIRATLNEEDNRINVFFESKEEFFENRNREKDIVLFSFLRDINSFFSRFRAFSIEWARSYMEIVNASRSSSSDAMSLENAISSILGRLELTDRQKNLLMGETCQMVKNNHEVILKDRSFYQIGMEYYEFEDNDSHYDNTNLKYVKAYDTPEKIIKYLAEKATVLGISATAEISTVIGNYDLKYLSSQLKEKYHVTPIYLKNKTRSVLEKRWKAYQNGEITVHGTIIDSNEQEDCRKYCEAFLENDELAHFATNIITRATMRKYEQMRYCNILRAMWIFNKTEDIRSMLYLGMVLPKRNHPEMDEKVLGKLFNLSKGDNKCDANSLYFLRGENFETDKEDLVKRLAKGEKVFVMSSYSTIGAGQNLQYVNPKDRSIVLLEEFAEGDNRFVYKDFDALYLGNITNIVVNTYQEEKIESNDLLKMLFQIEELYENFELNYFEKDKMLKLAFRSYSGSKEFTFNELYKLNSVSAQVSRIVLQAVGRMCRTFNKSPNIYLFAEAKLLEKLNVKELESRILSPEMEKIMDMYEQLGKCEQSGDNTRVNKAEKIASADFWFVQSILAKNWTEESMQLWEKLRELVLQYPTASKSQWEDNEYLQKLYITSGERQNKYLYSQYSSFSDVTIDFGNNKEAFRNSKRAKFRGNSKNLAIYEMNEEASRLPWILNYPGMKDHFEKHGYACQFTINEYLMSPILFHSIYKGALGEVAGKFILNKELGIELDPITKPEIFEFFDYQMSEGIYVDF